MKVWKLVSGIISIASVFIILVQSCATGIVNSLEGSSDIGGSAGIVVAILMLTLGIVSIATRTSIGKGGNIAIIILALLIAYFGFNNAEVYSDLAIWSGWAVICGVFALISIFINRGKNKNHSENE